MFDTPEEALSFVEKEEGQTTWNKEYAENWVLVEVTAQHLGKPFEKNPGNAKILFDPQLKT